MALTKIDDRGLNTPIDLLDNEKIRFGTGNDLELYHDGSNSYIKDVGTGFLAVQGSEVLLRSSGDEKFVHCVENGRTELYYDNVKKLETAGGGINITGDSYHNTDNGSSYYGAGSDLRIYHDGTNSNILNTTGDLRLLGKSGQVSIKIVPDAGVELRYNDVKKFETTSSGVVVSGVLEVNGGDVDFSDHLVLSTDSKKLKFGAGEDLQIYSDGDDGLIHAVTDDLRLQSADDITIKPQGGEDGIEIVGNGGVSLFYDNVKKFETSSLGTIIHHDGANAPVNALTLQNTGCNVGGGSGIFLKTSSSTNDNRYGTRIHTLRESSDNGASTLVISSENTSANALDERLRITAAGLVRIPDSGRFSAGSGDDVQLFHDGNNSFLENNTGNLYVRAKNGENSVTVKPDGAVELFYNNVKKFETTTTGFNVTSTDGHAETRYNSSYHEYADDTASGDLYANTNVFLFIAAQKSPGGSVNYPCALYHVPYTGAVPQQISASHGDFASSDTDDKICIYRTSNGVFKVKNRTGVTNKMCITMIHSMGV